MGIIPLPPKPAQTSQAFLVEQASPRLPFGPSSEFATIDALKASLESARTQYFLRHYNATKNLLNELETNLKRYMDGEPSDEQFAMQIPLILASVLCLYGRLSYTLGDQEEAKNAFVRSVRLFEIQKAEELARQNNRIRTDYAMALSRIGRMMDALNLLKEVCKSGVAPPEAFGYLGFAYQIQGHLAEAEEAYRNGLQLAPGDPKLLQYLAQTLKDERKNQEATSTYCDAALAAMRLEDIQAAAGLAHDALNITPTDAKALSIAVRIEGERQNIAGAMAIVEAVLQHDSKHQWALGLKATLLRESGKLEDTINILREIDVGTPDLAWILVEHARALHQINPDNDEKALSLLNRAYTLNPLAEGASYVHAEILIDRGEPTKAVDVLRHAMESERQNVILACELGRALFLANDLEGALKAFDEVLALDPKSIDAFVGRAVTLNEESKFDQALESIRRALHLDPDNDFIFQLMIDLLIKNDHVDGALEELDAKIQGKTQAPAYCYWLKGQILLERKELRAAQEMLEQAALLDPENSNVHLDLAEAFCRLDEYTKAGTEYNRALTLEQDSIYAITKKASYLIEIAAFQEALTLVRSAIERVSDQAWLSSLLNIQGWCLQHIGTKSSMEKARESFEQACAVDPEDVWCRKGLANTLCSLGREEDARMHFETIIEQEKYKIGNDAQILAVLGECHYRLHRYDEGMRLLQQAISVEEDPNAVIELHFDLALTMLAGSRFTRAYSEYQCGVDLASKKHVLQQRGLYYIALFDLVEAAAEGRIGSEGSDVFNLLRSSLEACKVELAKLDWLGDHLPVFATA